MGLLTWLDNALREERMVSTHVDVARAEWTSGSPFYGSAAIYEGNPYAALWIDA